MALEARNEKERLEKELEECISEKATLEEGLANEEEKYEKEMEGILQELEQLQDQIVEK